MKVKARSEAACGGSALTTMLGAAFLAGCTPAPLTDLQVQEITQQCRELGMATAIFNSGIVSRIECIPVNHEAVPNVELSGLRAVCEAPLERRVGPDEERTET